MIDFDLIKQQWEEEDEFERMSLEFMEPLFPAWVCLRNSTNVTGELINSFLEVTDASIKYCWGEDASVELGNWDLILIHPSGERIAKSLVET